jgi:hypothetical protein
LYEFAASGIWANEIEIYKELHAKHEQKFIETKSAANYSAIHRFSDHYGMPKAFSHFWELFGEQ